MSGKRSASASAAWSLKAVPAVSTRWMNGDFSTAWFPAARCSATSHAAGTAARRPMAAATDVGWSVLARFRPESAAGCRSAVDLAVRASSCICARRWSPTFALASYVVARRKRAGPHIAASHQVPLTAKNARGWFARTTHGRHRVTADASTATPRARAYRFADVLAWCAS
jgi:hypothetical protein